jgi:hypothetical protein
LLTYRYQRIRQDMESQVMNHKRNFLYFRAVVMPGASTCDVAPISLHGLIYLKIMKNNWCQLTTQLPPSTAAASEIPTKY